MKKSYLVGVAIVAVVGGVFFLAWTLVSPERPQLPERGEEIRAVPTTDPEAQRIVNEQALQEGGWPNVIPTSATSGEQSSNPVVRRIDIGRGQVMLFGKLTSFSNGELTIEYVEGTETVIVDEGTAIFEVPMQGEQQRRDSGFLTGLQYPQIGEVALDTDTDRAISVTVLPSR